MATAVGADYRGNIVDLPGLNPAGRSGNAVYPLDQKLLIPLPAGSRLFVLPGREAVGAGNKYCAVAAFLPPGYVILSIPAFIKNENAPALPLFPYSAVCWHRGKFHVPAVQVDADPRHDPCGIDMVKVKAGIRRMLKEQPDNRLLAHHGKTCALKYNCPNACNLFLERWEAPVAVSGGCNAACRGCISKKTSAAVQPPQERIDFTPTVEEIVALAVPHLEKGGRVMVSFGQGCEGEPLLKGDLIEKAIREIRKATDRGTVHLNTNGSRPDIVEKLIKAGLDSIRVSMNSAREKLYSAYYRCRGYSFSDVLRTLEVSGRGGIWTSINYLSFPGVTDDIDEYRAFRKILKKTEPGMIQWRNLNTDPDIYMNLVSTALPPKRSGLIGMKRLMEVIKKEFPKIRHGYFNPYI